MKNIYLIRHGITDWNILGRIQGYKNSSLTDEGKKQAYKAGLFLKDIEFDTIYSSDLSRAYDTATIINKNHNLEIVKTTLLRECSFGIWEGKTLEEVLKIDKDNYTRWLKEPETCNIEEGETLDELRSRCMDFLKSIKGNNQENILIVAHSTILKMMLLTILDIDNKHFKNLSLNNTGISKLEVKDYNTVLKNYNLTSHLKENFNE